MRRQRGAGRTPGVGGESEVGVGRRGCRTTPADDVAPPGAATWPITRPCHGAHAAPLSSRRAGRLRAHGAPTGEVRASTAKRGQARPRAPVSGTPSRWRPRPGPSPDPATWHTGRCFARGYGIASARTAALWGQRWRLRRERGPGRTFWRGHSRPHCPMSWGESAACGCRRGLSRQLSTRSRGHGSIQA